MVDMPEFHPKGDYRETNKQMHAFVLDSLVEIVECMGQLGTAISTDGMCADVPERLMNLERQLTDVKEKMF